MNPRVGSRMQQACKLTAAEAVEVVRNHEDGTRLREWHLEAEGASRKRGVREWMQGVTAEAEPGRAVDGGASGGAVRVTELTLPTPREEDQATGRGSSEALRRGAKRGPTIHRPRGRGVGVKERKTSKVRADRAIESSVRSRRERGRPNDPLRVFRPGEQR